MDRLPVVIPALGKDFTITLSVPEAIFIHPLPLITDTRLYVLFNIGVTEGANTLGEGLPGTPNVQLVLTPFSI